MTKEKKTVLPNIEMLIILVLVVSFVIMAIAQCNKTKSRYQKEEISQKTPISNAAPDTTAIPPPVKKLPPKPKPVISPPLNVPTTSRLYVTLEDLNLRTGPSLDSTVLVTLPLFEEVYFMDEVTDFKQRIRLSGSVTAVEPWIKVRSKKGHVGWVYGAGVHYYKKKRLEDTPMPVDTIATPPIAN